VNGRALHGNLHGKVVAVTGAAQGIGRAYARRLIAEGCQVIMADRDHGRVIEAANGIAGGAAVGGKAVPRHLDVADEQSCDALAAEILDTYGRLDGLVNNAAIFSTITMKPFWELTVSEWDAVLAVNLRGPWLLTRALLEALRNSARSSGGASVVNVASDAVWQGRPGYLHYVASKAGVAGMTHAMAHELGEANIRVNTVSPGPVYTEIPRATVTEAQKAAMLAAQALKRPAGPDDLAGTVVFLLSDDSAYITGQTIHVNGGLIHR